MALINCPECGNQMSDTAKKRFSQRMLIKNKERNRLLVFLLTFIVFIGIFQLTVSCQNKNETDNEYSDPIKEAGFDYLKHEMELDEANLVGYVYLNEDKVQETANKHVDFNVEGVSMGFYTLNILNNKKEFWVFFKNNEPKYACGTNLSDFELICIFKVLCDKVSESDIKLRKMQKDFYFDGLLPKTNESLKKYRGF